jgi:hypothetical protein
MGKGPYTMTNPMRTNINKKGMSTRNHEMLWYPFWHKTLSKYVKKTMYSTLPTKANALKSVRHATVPTQYALGGLVKFCTKRIKNEINDNNKYSAAGGHN